MLRRASRSSSSGGQALTMADSASSLQSQSGNYKKPMSSCFFSSPRLFTNFTSKGFNETETIMSPTSILDTNRPFSAFKNPFWSETNSPRTPSGETKRYSYYSDSKGVGLGLVDSLLDDSENQKLQSKPENRMVLFGSHLKIQIPPIAPSEPPQSPKISANSNSYPGVFAGCLSASEIELSEEYTRVISRGPNPRTTHIFDNCVIESSCFDLGVGFCAPATATGKENGFVGVADDINAGYPSQSFLSFCFYCKKNLGQGKDIYMYRGEMAFCSRECRYQGMLMEEGMEKWEAEDVCIS